ncbi:MAG TPA: cation-transporting P-type ATPase [Anaerolineaceae bacterium]|nr:cation-transporting P-type ATPase [Anaerolineaceae bacterium]
MEAQLNPLSAELIERIQELTPDQLFQELNSRPEGLAQDEVALRLGVYGPNVLQEVKGKPLILKFLANFTHVMAIMLWLAGIGAFIAKMPELGIAVWSVNIINGGFSFFQEFRAEKATQALKKILPSQSRVMRNGEEASILAQDLVPGDVIFLQEGDNIPADCRLLNSADLRVNQSTLTGESHPVNRSAEPVSGEDMTRTDIPNLIFAGTFVAAGSGKAIVYATGMNTNFGHIAQMTQALKEELSPLQKEMKNATKIVTIIAMGVGLVFLIAARLMVNIPLLDSFIFTLGMVVAFVPEGMLPTVTLALAMGTQRMAKRNALIKKLSAVETLGCTNVICTDKTGTLTQNEMTVRAVWVPASYASEPYAGREIAVGGTGYEPTGNFTENGAALDPRSQYALSQVILTQAKCNTARLLPPEIRPDGTKTGWKVLGDPTEAALLVLADKAGYSRDDLQSDQNVAELPFDSRRKRMSVVHLQRVDGNLQRVAYVKGGIREVLDACSSVRVNDQVIPISPEWVDFIMARNDAYARQGLRVLAAAARVLPRELSEYQVESIETDLTFLGMVAMMDPPRADVTEAVKKCHRAGIRIIMITGDYGLTAESIARRIGIVQGEDLRVITGGELENMSDEELEKAVQGQVIFARVAPEHKLRVVSALQKLGSVVAVTGDGVNDAPALKKADIGVAMGLSGSDVAKEAADMILIDDNFGSIVNAIEEGRAVYENIKRFSTYIFTSNAPEAVPFMAHALSGARIPIALNVMQVLSIDLGTDIMPALALGTEPPEKGTMDRPPRKLSEHLITGQLLTRAYLILGPVQSLAAMSAFYFYYWTNGYAGQWLNLPASGPVYKAATTMALAAVVFSQIGNLFAQRASRQSIFKTPLFNNKLVWYGILSELILILAMVYVPFMQRFIGTGPFEAKYWLFHLLWIPSLPIVDAIRKALVSRKEKRVLQKQIIADKGETI